MKVMSIPGENSAIFGVDVSVIHASSSNMAHSGRSVTFSASIDNDNPVSPPRYWTQQDQIDGLAAQKSRKKKVVTHKVVRVRKSGARKIYADILENARKTMKLSVADVNPLADPETNDGVNNDDDDDDEGVVDFIGDTLESTEGEGVSDLATSAVSSGDISSKGVMLTCPEDDGDIILRLAVAGANSGVISVSTADANKMEDGSDGTPPVTSGCGSSTSDTTQLVAMRALTSPFLTSVNAGQLSSSVLNMAQVPDLMATGHTPPDANYGGHFSSSSSSTSPPVTNSGVTASASLVLASPSLTSVIAGQLSVTVPSTTQLYDQTTNSDPYAALRQPWADYEWPDDDDDYDYGSSHNNISSGQGPTDAPKPDDLILTAKRKGNFDTEISDGTYVAADWVKFYSYQLFIDVAEWNDLTISNIIVNEMTSGMVHNTRLYQSWMVEGRQI
jgi:hypothetical protein